MAKPMNRIMPLAGAGGNGVGIVRNANHGGVSRGSQSWLLVFPDYGMSIAFNTNMNTDEFAEFGIFYREMVEVFAPVAGQGEE